MADFARRFASLDARAGGLDDAAEAADGADDASGERADASTERVNASDERVNTSAERVVASEDAADASSEDANAIDDAAEAKAAVADPIARGAKASTRPAEASTRCAGGAARCAEATATSARAIAARVEGLAERVGVVHGGANRTPGMPARAVDVVLSTTILHEPLDASAGPRLALRAVATRRNTQPHYPLSLVAVCHAVRVGRGRAREEVKKLFWRLRKPMNDRQAETYVRDVVARLTPAEFVQTTELLWAERSPVRADVYGVRNAHGDWYVKLYVHDSQLIVASCHPPAGPLVQADGLQIGRSRR